MARPAQGSPSPRPLPSPGSALLSIALVLLGGWGVLFSEGVASRLAGVLSPDGLSPPLLRTLTRLVAMAGLLALIAGLAAWFYSAKISATWAIARERLGERARNTWASFTAWVNASPREAVLLVLVTAMGTTLRAFHMADPIRGDEAFSFLHFVAHGPVYLLSHYHTNSHTLHSLLVWISTTLFGTSEVAVRLPSFLASVLAIPAFFLLARRWYSPGIAMVATPLFAGHSWIVEYGVLSRGYSLQMLLVIALAIVFQRAHTSAKTAPSIPVALLTCALFFTVLTSLYPVALLWSWHLWVSFRQRQFSRAYALHLSKTLAITIALGLLVFAPILVISKVSSITGNYYVQPLTWLNFVERSGPALAELFAFAHYGWPRWLAGLSAIFAIIALLPDTSRSARFPSPLLMVPIIVALLCLQRVIPYTRIWIWGVPFYQLLIVTGCWRLLRPTAKFLRLQFASPARALVFAILIPFLAILPYNAHLVRASMEGSPNRDDPLIATWLASHLQPGDRVLADTIYVRLHYYFTRLKLDAASLGSPPNEDSQAVYLIRIPDGAQNRITSILPENHPEWTKPKTAATFLHGSRVDVVRRIPAPAD